MNLHDLYSDIGNHLMRDTKPSIYLNEIYETPLFQEYPFNLLYKLQSTEQSPVYHPEGNAWNHTLLVVDEAARMKSKSKNSTVFMWAALLHDIGKPSTTKIRNGKITAYDHDKVGEKLSKEFLLKFTSDEDFIYEVSKLIRYHMQLLYVVNNLPFANIKGMKHNTDVHEVALLGLCDKLGRTNSDRIKEEAIIKLFLGKVDKKDKASIQ